ncbi:MAG: carboxymuconolactone decarboxylase family protein [Alphaproteobacteria bacterium]
MTRLTPLDPAALPELAETFAATKARTGFIPTSQKVMARRPELLKAFGALARAVFADRSKRVSPGLKSLLGHVASLSAGCQYCQAHTAGGVIRHGDPADAAKLAAVWSYETSPLFSDAERAALAFAQAAAAVPNAATDEHFAALRKHYDEDEIVDMLGVIAYYGFLNRWNDSLATTLEAEPLEVGTRHLAAGGWQAGKHAAE